MTYRWMTFISLAAVLLLAGCGKEQVKSIPSASEISFETLAATAGVDLTVQPLPDGLEWITNDNEPVWASPDAVKGGTLHTFTLAFPLCLRTVGPDSNGHMCTVLRENSLGLTSIHPVTDQVIPQLATHWAYGADGRTVYYKIDNRARWSDGEPVTADDWLFGLAFMRSDHIIKAPWYKEYYTDQINEVRKHDDYTISIVGKVAKPRKDLHIAYGMNPQPQHFYKMSENWLKDYNWEIAPNTGPYLISEVEKGKSITLTRVKDWWAKDLRLNKGRFNVDRVHFRVIRDMNVAWEYYLKGELDFFSLTLPEYWHDKAQGTVFDKGYAHKIWFYNDTPQPDYGIWLNQDKEIFKDKNVRYAFAHAMNVDKVLKDVLRGDYFRLHTNTTGYGEYMNKEIRARPYSIEKVQELMAASGWARGPDGVWAKGGQRYSVTVTYGQKHHEERLVVLKQEALKAGIELNLQILDGSAAFKKMLEKQHEVAWSGWGAMYRPEYWGRYHSDNAHKDQTNNFSNTADKGLDELIMKYRDGTKEEDRIELAKEIQARIHEEGAYIPTFLVPYFRETYWRWWKFPEVLGTRHSESLLDPFGSGLFWFDAAAKEETLAARKSGKAFEPVTRIDTKFKAF